MSTPGTEPADTNLGASGVPTRASARDLGAARAALEPWLARALHAPDLALGPVRTPGASGVANETLLCDATWTAHGEARAGAFVVRTQSPDFLYKDADLSNHVAMSRALSDVAGVPVPTVVGDERDASILGQPFFVMEHVEGRVPEDSPPFHSAGWVFDLAPARRAVLWDDAIAVMARLHAVDPGRLTFLDRPALGVSGLEQDLRSWIEYGVWAARGRHVPVVGAATDWLLANLPADAPTGLAWGDARVGNMIFRDERVVAVLDWDMVSLAGAESDLAWWSIMDLLYTDSAGVARLDGIGSPAETVARWEEHAGCAARHLPYQLVFAAYRMAVVLVRLADLLGAAGVLPADVATGMLTGNSGIQYLATMIDLPFDGPLTTPWPGVDGWPIRA